MGETHFTTTRPMPLPILLPIKMCGSNFDSEIAFPPGEIFLLNIQPKLDMHMVSKMLSSVDGAWFLKCFRQLMELYHVLRQLEPTLTDKSAK